MDDARKLYSEYRNELLKRQLYNNESYDKAILTLSSSGLALSLAIYNLSPIEHSSSAQLVWAWAFYLFAIFASITAYLISNKAIDKQIEIAERYYINQELDAYDEKNWLSSTNNFLNTASGISLLAAIAFTLIFFHQTVKLNEVAMSTNNKVTGFAIDSASIPKMVNQSSVGERVQNSAQVPKMQAVPLTPAPQPKAEGK